MTRAELQKEREGGDSLLATTGSSIMQQHRTTFHALKHTRSTYKPAINQDSGLTFDASSEVRGGRDLALVALGGRVKRAWTHI